MASRRDPPDDTGRAASRYSAKVAAARAQLAARMQERGLTAAAGWRVYEETISTPEGMAFRLRPMHLREAPPPDMEVIVKLD